MSEETSRERTLQIALGVAEILSGSLLSVEGIGFFGSLARGEQAEDIDLIVFLHDAEIPEGLLEDAEIFGFKLYPWNWQSALPDLGADMELVDQVTGMLGGTPLDIIIMPAVPSDEYLDSFATLNRDPNFLRKVSRDFQRYDPKSGEFVPARAPWQDYLDEQGAGERSEASTEVSTLTRPSFGPRQVLTLRGISRGLVLKDSWRGEIVVLGSPYERGDKAGAYGYDYAGCGKSGWYRNSAYCSDVGVLPYEDGRWNTTNYLLRTGRRRLSEKETQAIEAAIQRG